MIQAKFSFNKDKTINVLKSLKANGVTIASGVPKEKNKGLAATLLAIHCHGSKSHNIPKRDPYDSIRYNKRAFTEMLRQCFYRHVTKASIKQPMQDELINAGEEIGFRTINDFIKPYILSNGQGRWPSLKPATIKLKHGSRQMLIWSGNMYSCLGHKVKQKTDKKRS